MVCGILGLGIQYSAYLSEVYRAGIENLQRGQWEACTALGFSSRRTWRRIVLPQILPPMAPVFGNYVIQMFKDTPLLATITVMELLGTALNDASHSFRYVEPITIVGATFLVLSYSSSIVVRKLERKFAVVH
jgi:polar amino acid transport system permease protein